DQIVAQMAALTRAEPHGEGVAGVAMPKTEAEGGTAAAAPAEPRPGVRELAVRYGLIAITVALFVVFALAEQTFRQPSTLFSTLKFASVVAVAGLGVTLAMVVGGLDLAVGAVAGMAVTISAMTMVIYAQVGGVAIALVLLAGALIGAVNALLIVVLRIPDLLATLATMFIVMGLKLVTVDGQ